MCCHGKQQRKLQTLKVFQDKCVSEDFYMGDAYKHIFLGEIISRIPKFKQIQKSMCTRILLDGIEARSCFKKIKSSIFIATLENTNRGRTLREIQVVWFLTLNSFRHFTSKCQKQCAWGSLNQTTLVFCSPPPNHLISGSDNLEFRTRIS